MIVLPADCAGPGRGDQGGRAAGSSTAQHTLRLCCFDLVNSSLFNTMHAQQHIGEFCVRGISPAAARWPRYLQVTAHGCCMLATLRLLPMAGSLVRAAAARRRMPLQDCRAPCVSAQMGCDASNLHGGIAFAMACGQGNHPGCYRHASFVITSRFCPCSLGLLVDTAVG